MNSLHLALEDSWEKRPRVSGLGECGALPRMDV